MADAPRLCIRCGLKGPFRDPAALKCTRCDGETASEREQYQKDYQRARRRATEALIKKHRPEFERLMLRERRAVELLREEEGY